MINIKDYLHYYIGTPVFLCNNLEGNPVIEPLTPKMLHEDEEMFTDPENGPYMPILRRLSDMTDEDLKAMINHFSKVDLSDCEYELEIEGDKWINAIEKHGGRRVIASLAVLDGDYISLQMMDDMGDMQPLIPQADGFHYLLKHGFDLWNLIDNNLAIDIKTIK